MVKEMSTKRATRAQQIRSISYPGGLIYFILSQHAREGQKVFRRNRQIMLSGNHGGFVEDKKALYDKVIDNFPDTSQCTFRIITISNFICQLWKDLLES